MSLDTEYSLDVELEDGFLDDLEASPFDSNEATELPEVTNVQAVLNTNVSWIDFDLSRPLLKAILELGYPHPSHVQSRVIPVALLGRDVIVTSATGSGKTAAFLIPLIQRLYSCNFIRPLGSSAVAIATKALVLVPTRELALQCYQVYTGLCKYLQQQCLMLTGGISVKDHETKLQKMPLVIIATPGRLLDLILNSSQVVLDSVEMLVLDEADRLLEMGFKDEICKIIEHCSQNRQTMLFSATMGNKTADLATISLTNPINIQLDANNELRVASGIDFDMVLLPDEKYRDAAALYCCKVLKGKTIYFFGTKESAKRMSATLQIENVPCAILHGDLDQTQRFEEVKRFSGGDVNILVATDLAARGLDVENVETVVNVNIPNDAVRFIHRVGRCARMGKRGVAITLYIDKERSTIKAFLKAVSNAKFKRRKLSSGTLEPFMKKLTELKPEVDSLLNEMAVERELDLAESKIANKNGEARTWFQTKSEKIKTLKLERQELKKSRNELLAASSGRKSAHGDPTNSSSSTTIGGKSFSSKHRPKGSKNVKRVGKASSRREK